MMCLKRGCDCIGGDCREGRLYILPEFASDPEVIVRVTYAQCIASIAESALRFLVIHGIDLLNFRLLNQMDH